MKKPTKKQRLQIYQQALTAVKKSEEAFSCNQILFYYAKMFNLNPYLLSFNETTLLFPEFIKQKPKDNPGGGLWFCPSLHTDKQKQAKRIKIFKKCIKLITIN